MGSSVELLADGKTLAKVRGAVRRAMARAEEGREGLRPCSGTGCSAWGAANAAGPVFNCGAHCERCFGAGWLEESPGGQGTWIPCRCRPLWKRLRQRADGRTHLHCDVARCAECRSLTGTAAAPEEVERQQRERMFRRDT